MYSAAAHLDLRLPAEPVTDRCPTIQLACLTSRIHARTKHFKGSVADARLRISVNLNSSLLPGVSILKRSCPSGRSRRWAISRGPRPRNLLSRTLSTRPQWSGRSSRLLSRSVSRNLKASVPIIRRFLILRPLWHPVARGPVHAYFKIRPSRASLWCGPRTERDRNATPTVYRFSPTRDLKFVTFSVPCFQLST